MYHNKILRYGLFGLLYFTQGTVLSYFTALNAIYLLDNGLTMTNVGIFSSIALIPFVIKIFFGMLSDKVNFLGLGHRKPYIILGLSIQTICLILVPFINPNLQYWLFVGLAFILQCGMALYDTCTDGLAVDVTEKEEQGIIQGFMVGGRALGVVLTASAVGLLAQESSWQAVFWLLAGLTLLPLPLVLGLTESKRPRERTFEWGAFRAFRKPNVLALSAAGLLIFMIIVGVNQLVNPFMESAFEINLSTAGFFTTIWGIGVVLGGIAGGGIVAKIGRQRSLLASVLTSLIVILILAFTPSLPFAWVIVIVFGLSYGVSQTVYFALAMNYTDSRIAASMFSILMAFTNIGQGIGLAAGGLLVDQIDYKWTFVIFALLNVLVLPFIGSIFKKKEDVVVEAA